MAFVVVEKGNSVDIGKRFSFDEGAIIGRRTTEFTPDIPIHDEYISRRHAEITFVTDHFVLHDLNSTNGTAIDGQRIEPGKPYSLTDDSVIGLGVASGIEARVILRFREFPTVSTSRMAVTEYNEVGPIGWLRIDEKNSEIWVDKKEITVTKKEFDLILCLLKRSGKVCQRDELIAEVWPEVSNINGVSDAAIDQLIRRLRLKIEPDPSHPKRHRAKARTACMGLPDSL